MNVPELRIRLLHVAFAGSAVPYLCEEIALGTPGGPRATLVDLLVVDARGMAPDALRRALRQAADWNATGTFRRGLLVAPKPELESVVLAIRAGLHEVVPAGVGALHLVRLLCGATANPAQRRERLRRLLQLLRVGRPAARRGGRTPEQEQSVHLEDEQRTRFEHELAGREAALLEREAMLARREQDLRATAARVQTDLDRAQQACAMIELAGEMRAELEKRENELRLMARQAAAAQPDERAAAPDPTPVALRRELESLVATQQLSLDRRERALATRERWLRDYEQALTGRLVTSEVN